MTDATAPHTPAPTPDRNLALELVRVTEAAAMATGRWVGRNDAAGALAAAINAMRSMIGTVEMKGTIVIGEGTDDDEVRLGGHYDVAVDPIDGITFTAKGLSHAMSVLAVAPSGAMFDPSVCLRINKLVAGREARDQLDIRQPVAENVHRLAKVMGRQVEDVTVGMLARPYHEDLAREVREAGARIRFLTGGDVSAAITAASPRTGIDMLIGLGGTAEAVIAACAVKCLGGVLQGRLSPRDATEEVRLQTAGVDLDAVLECDDLVRGDDAFVVLTGVTDGDLVAGVRYGPGTATTESLGDARAAAPSAGCRATTASTSSRATAPSTTGTDPLHPRRRGARSRRSATRSPSAPASGGRRPRAPGPRRSAGWTQKHQAWIAAQRFDDPARSATLAHYRTTLTAHEAAVTAIEADLNLWFVRAPFADPVARLAHSDLALRFIFSVLTLGWRWPGVA